MDYTITTGNFDDLLENYINSLDVPIHLAFIDGNHREEATLRYHSLIKPFMDNRGVIVHDDISWSDGMISAWKKIKLVEQKNKIAELWLGNRPSRGIIFLGTNAASNIEIEHIDSILERLIRRAKRYVL